MQRTVSSSVSTGTFSHLATSSFYGTKIEPPLHVEVTFEMYQGRPVFREAIDQRGISHEIELLDPAELRQSYDRHLGAESALDS